MIIIGKAAKVANVRTVVGRTVPHELQAVVKYEPKAIFCMQLFCSQSLTAQDPVRSGDTKQNKQFAE